MKELIVVKQLPQIEEHLKELSAEIDKKVENAKSLVCTDENVKAIKQVRADLNKEFKEVEQQRKVVKEQILAPYMQFEEIYKTYITVSGIECVTLIGNIVKLSMSILECGLISFKLLALTSIFSFCNSSLIRFIVNFVA